MPRLSTALFLFTAPVLLAQSGTVSKGDPDATAIILRSIPAGTNCPIAFRASRQATAQILTASDAEKNGPALGLHLTLDQPATSGIESIEVTVYGVSSKSRIVLADFQAAGGDARHDVSQSFLLQRSADDKSLSNADVWVHQVGALRWVDLNEIRYTDGSIWRASGFETCRAVPSNVLLVGQRSIN